MGRYIFILPHAGIVVKGSEASSAKCYEALRGSLRAAGVVAYAGIRGVPCRSQDRSWEFVREGEMSDSSVMSILGVMGDLSLWNLMGAGFRAAWWLSSLVAFHELSKPKHKTQNRYPMCGLLGRS